MSKRLTRQRPGKKGLPAIHPAELLRDDITPASGQRAAIARLPACRGRHCTRSLPSRRRITEVLIREAAAPSGRRSECPSSPRGRRARR